MLRNFAKNPSLLDTKNVLYIAYIGKYKNKDFYKYGKSSNLQQRILTHKKTFDKFDLQFVYHTNYNDYVENSFENELKIRDIHDIMMINNKKQTELFHTSDIYTLDYLNDIMNNLIKAQELSNINYLQYERDRIQLEKMHLKIKLKELDLQIKNIDYKIKSL
jgi:hypothetical protein